MKDLLDDPNLATREYWTHIEHPELNTAITYPKQFVKSTETDLSTRVRAPLIGEHNGEIYSEIGLSGGEIVALKEAGVI